jgi:Uma2 family endonuclease
VRDYSGVHVDECNYVIPDLVFISRERLDIIGDANIEAGPDLVVEIVSPSTRRIDLLVKRAL